MSRLATFFFCAAPHGPGLRTETDQRRGLSTYFGDISFWVESKLKQHTITARIDAPTGAPYHGILLNLRHPSRARIQHVLVNGKDHRDCDYENGIVRLAAGSKTYSVEVRY